MKTVKSLSAVLALTLGMSVAAGVSALQHESSFFAAPSEPKAPVTYFGFTFTQTDLDKKITDLKKAWEAKEKQQTVVKELTTLRCDLLKAIASKEFVYNNYEKLRTATLVTTTETVLTANVNKKGEYAAAALTFTVPAGLEISEKDADELADLVKGFNDENAKVTDAATASAKVNELTINGVKITTTGTTTRAQVVLNALNKVQEKVNFVKSDSYQADVTLIKAAKAQNDKKVLFNELTTLNNELNKLDDFVSVLGNLDAKIFDESCPIKFAGKLPVADSTKAEEKKAEAAKDNVPNTAATAATTSVAFASIFAAAAAVVAKRK